MPLAHSPHAPFSLSKLDPVGVCDRCEFKYPLAALAWQMEWAGPTMVNLKLRVCPRCLDTPQEQFRTIVIGPDPAPLKDPRPPRYPVQAHTPAQFVLDDPDDGQLDEGNFLGVPPAPPPVITPPVVTPPVVVPPTINTFTLDVSDLDSPDVLG